MTDEELMGGRKDQPLERRFILRAKQLAEAQMALEKAEDELALLTLSLSDAPDDIMDTTLQISDITQTIGVMRETTDVLLWSLAAIHREGCGSEGYSLIEWEKT
jgi:hypothetical protein